MRLIDADALMNEFAEYVRESNNRDFADVPTWNDAVSLVRSAPTIEPPCRVVANVTLSEKQLKEAFEKAKLEIISTIAPERKKGKWIQHYVGQEHTPWGSDCSVCGEWLVIDRLVMNEKYRFCPACGAMMEGEQDE